LIETTLPVIKTPEEEEKQNQFSLKIEVIFHKRKMERQIDGPPSPLPLGS